MKEGYSKTIYEEHNNTLFNVVAVSEIVNKYNFRNTYHCTYTLERAFNTIKILYEGPEKIDIIVFFNIDINPDKKVALSERLMRLNNAYNMNLSIIDKRVFCNYTVYCRAHMLSEDAFSAVFERHINTIDAHKDEIFSTICQFTIPLYDKEFPPFDVEDFARYLERRQAEKNRGQSIREYENEIFNLREIDPNNFDDEDEED